MTARDTTPNAAEILGRLQRAAAAAATDEEARAVANQMRAFARRIKAARWEPYPWQHPHTHPEGWVSLRAPGKDVCDERCALLPRAPIPVHGAWLQRSGRGCGKTEGAAHYINAHVEGPPCDVRVPGGHRVTIVAPTQADAVSSCVTGVSGLQTINPGIEVSTGREGTLVRWPNGAVGRLLGAHTQKDVERVRAWTNICAAWVEEAGAMVHLGGLPEVDTERQGVLDQLPFTLRLGDSAHMVVTTTPRNRPEVVHLFNTAAVTTWGRTQDADRLPPVVREALETRFRGTTAGAQELDGDLIADVPGALWVQHRPTLVDGLPNPDQRPGIDNDRVDPADYGWLPHARPETLGGDGITVPDVAAAHLMQRVIIAVDPPGGRTECGIVAVGTIGNHGYALADLSLAGPPDTWARVALCAYYDFGAEGLAVEHTYGGDMVPAVISTAAVALGVPVPPIFKVPTKVGKRLRAEPVQGLYQQHRFHHVGELPGLETEQRTWVPDMTTDSPNRIDALVHGGTYLMVRRGAGTVSNAASLVNRRAR